MSWKTAQCSIELRGTAELAIILCGIVTTSDLFDFTLRYHSVKLLIITALRTGVIMYSIQIQKMLKRRAYNCTFLQNDLSDLSTHLPFHPSIYQSIIHSFYSPSTSLFNEQMTPDALQMTPRLSIHTSISRSLTVRRPHCSLRWNRHGSMSVMAAPVTLPVKPINRENLGTSRARRYEVISKAPRTNRAGRDTPRPPCLERNETAASAERLKQRSWKGAKSSWWQFVLTLQATFVYGRSILTHCFPVASGGVIRLQL